LDYKINITKQRDPKTIIHKQILTFNIKAWILIKKNKSQFQTKALIFMRSTERKTRMDRIRNYIIREDTGIQNL
jgi:hypothetical protein